MKIAMVSEHASPLAPLGGTDAGGQNVHVAALSATLAQRGHDVIVYTRHDGTHSERTIHTDDGYRVVHVPAGPPRPIPKDEILPHLGEFAAFLRDDWAREHPDVVHAHFWMSGMAAELAAHGTGIPVLVTFHALGTVKHRYQGRADTSPPARIRIERLVASRSARVIATCSDEVGELTKMGVPPHHVSVVPCGVDLDLFTPDGPVAERGAPHRILSVGRMVPRKGYDLAIAALRELPDTELVIAGGADDKGKTHAEARRLRGCAHRIGVGDRVHLLGSVEHTAMPELIRSADVVACTPWYEPFGIVPLEAMGCARPVVATAVGGMLDTVVDGVTGALVAPNSPEALAAAIRPLLDNPHLAASRGAAGRRRAENSYSWERVGTRTLTAYRKVCARRVDRAAMSA
ncbi:glycosyltransferase [Nocardia coubleae]|uniref:Glycosyltransferase family 1 protein n=1 Tax=Nocardia coubleae TaxID=356147 RepID=A0A846VZQ7_9NOCA|nr:glycosyltransferase [Nocardia coubleae]NKX86331.1 glycosyltransferase family 1 protein [Nocardia coubleae]